MALHGQFAALTTGSVTHKARTSVSGYGAPSYSTAKTYSAYYEPQQRKTTTERVDMLRVDTFRDLDGQHHIEVSI